MSYFPIIVLTVVLFAALAAVLLIPIYIFLRKEEEASKLWTPEQLARRIQKEQERADSPRDSTPNEPS